MQKIPKIPQVLERLQYLYHGIGLTTVIKRIFHKIFTPIYRRDLGYIVIRDINLSDDGINDEEIQMSKPRFDLLLFKSLESLISFRNELLDPEPFKRVLRHIKSDINCFVLLAVQKHEKDKLKKRLIGYRVCERGVFVAPNNRESIPDDILFVNYSEVLHPFRGQQILLEMQEATKTICRNQGIRKICGVVLAHNRPSLIANTRSKDILTIGPFEWVSAFFNRYKRNPPIKTILDAIENGESGSTHM